MTEDLITKVFISKDCYINVNRREFYKLKNTILLIDDDGSTTPSRFVPLESECWLIIPEKLVPRMPIKIEGTKVEKKRRKTK